MSQNQIDQTLNELEATISLSLLKTVSESLNDGMNTAVAINNYRNFLRVVNDRQDNEMRKAELEAFQKTNQIGTK